jgi:hypothetical protein
MQPAVDPIGRKCPKFVRTRWSFIMDIRDYFVDHFLKATYFLMDCHEALGYGDRLSADVFQLYAILLPFYCLIDALESRACALPDIVP